MAYVHFLCVSFVYIYFPLFVQIIVANAWYTTHREYLYIRGELHTLNIIKSEVMKDFKKNKIPVCMCVRALGNLRNSVTDKINRMTTLCYCEKIFEELAYPISNNLLKTYNRDFAI